MAIRNLSPRHPIRPGSPQPHIVATKVRPAAEQLGKLGDPIGEEEVLEVFEKDLAKGMDAQGQERIRMLAALAIGEIGTEKLKKLYGEKITLMGGLDTRTMVANDREAITKELASKLPGACKGGGYIIHSDHSIPDQVEFETYEFFVNKAQEIAGGSPKS